MIFNLIVQLCRLEERREPLFRVRLENVQKSNLKYFCNFLFGWETVALHRWSRWWFGINVCCNADSSCCCCSHFYLFFTFHLIPGSRQQQQQQQQQQRQRRRRKRMQSKEISFIESYNRRFMPHLMQTRPEKEEWTQLYSKSGTTTMTTTIILEAERMCHCSRFILSVFSDLINLTEISFSSLRLFGKDHVWAFFYWMV